MKSPGTAAVSGLEEKRLLRDVEDLREREEPGRIEEISVDFGRVLLLDLVDSSPLCFFVGEPPSSRFVRVKARLRGRDRDLLPSFESSSSRLLGLCFRSPSAVVGGVEEVDDPLPPR
jgi:hypothetical protein